MTRLDALKKLLALGDLTLPEIRVVMGGCQLTLDSALFTELATGELTYRNAGAGQRLWTLPRAMPARCQAAQGRAVRDGVRVL